MNPAPPPKAPAPDNPEDQAWLETLAGQPMNTTSAHQALQLRRYFAQRDELEAQHAPSAESQARMLSKLQRAGVLKASQAAAPSTSALAHRLTAFLDWLIPVGPGAAPRYALIAGVALVAMVAPVFMQPHAPSHHSDWRSGNRTVPLGANVHTLLAHNPAQTAQEIQAALHTVGVSADIRSQADGLLLRAAVHPADQMPLQQALAPWGVTAPSSGALELRIVAIGRP
jgi:hypothetical protein